MNTLSDFSNIAGIVGVIFLLTAFFLLNTNKLSPKDLKYQIMNLSGAILILFSLFFHWNTASVLIEIAWIIISLIGIFKTIRNTNKMLMKDNIYSLFDNKKSMTNAETNFNT